MDFYSFILALILGAIIGLGAFFFSAGVNSKPSTTTKKSTEEPSPIKQQQEKKSNSTTTSSGESTSDSATVTSPSTTSIPDVTILFASQRGAAKEVARQVEEALAPKLRPFRISSPPIDVKDFKNVEELKNHKRVIFILPTYEGGTPPPTAQQFADDLLDLVQDFRVPRDYFGRIRFAVMGLGDAQYAKTNFCKFAKDVTQHMITLGAERLCPTMCVDEPHVQTSAVTFSHKVCAAIQRGSTVEEEKKSKENFLDNKRHQEAQDARDEAAAKESGSCCKNKSKNNDDDDDDQQQGDCGCESKKTSSSSTKNRNNKKGAISSGVTDEEIDRKNAKVDDDEKDHDHGNNNNNDDDDDEDSCSDSEGDIEEIIAAPRKQLLYPRLRRNLEKQGYGLIGSHSGVKLCRWTKSMLRGRGGCYKHTFYNISSFQCMEMTPSLACANKCVFCWRHHTNPVARSFQWEHDPPQFLVEGGIHRHQNMIRAMRGVPGVIPARLEEAMTVRHCALSLVGEPIMYPEINKFLSLLHERHISSFLVTNAQFPEQMENLTPVTQLYLSIDASTPEDLKAVDRPLFEDYWERMIACIKELSRKPFRTVFRLTLVNDYNVQNLKEYTDLIRLGNPHFVEVKGVTFCGAGSASDLTMKNVPYHTEVVKFCEGLCALLPGYEIACEHEHSCCMLIAKKTFKVNGKWHTWINYEKFFELCESGRTDFTAMEYAMETPDWAVFDSSEHGFDPKEIRHKKGVPIIGAGC